MEIKESNKELIEEIKNELEEIINFVPNDYNNQLVLMAKLVNLLLVIRETNKLVIKETNTDL